MKKSKKKVLKKSWTLEEVEEENFKEVQKFKKTYDLFLKKQGFLKKQEDIENIDIVEQFNNLKKALDIQIEKEQQRRSYGKVSYLLINSTRKLSTLHNSLATLSAERKPKKETQQRNIGLLRDCIAEFREAVTLLGLGDKLGSLSFKFYINITDRKHDKEIKKLWKIQEDNRLKIAKRIAKADINPSPPLHDES